MQTRVISLTERVTSYCQGPDGGGEFIVDRKSFVVVVGVVGVVFSGEGCLWL